MPIGAYLFSLIPDFNTYSGFFFWTFSLYSVLLFSSWLAAPALDKELEMEMKKEEADRKGKEMRKRNKMKDS